MFDQLPATIMMLDQCGTTLDPIAIIHVSDTVNVSDLGDVDMTAYGAVKALAAAVMGDVLFEVLDMIKGALGLLLERL